MLRFVLSRVIGVGPMATNAPRRKVQPPALEDDDICRNATAVLLDALVRTGTGPK